MATSINNPNWADMTEIGKYGSTGSYYRDSAGNVYVGKSGKTGGLTQVSAGASPQEAQTSNYINNVVYDDYLKNTTPQKIAEEQSKVANEFRANAPKYTGLLQDQSKKTIQRDLAENMAGLKQRSANAGFLKGSGTQKQQAEALAGAQTQTMAKDLDISDAIESQAKQFENQALATKMSIQGSANQATIDSLRQNILDAQRQSELWKTLGSVVGSGIGTYYGRKTT